MTETDDSSSDDNQEQSQTEYEIWFWETHHQTFTIVNGGLLALSVGFLASSSLDQLSVLIFTVCSFFAMFSFLCSASHNLAVTRAKRDPATLTDVKAPLISLRRGCVSFAFMTALLFLAGLCSNMLNGSASNQTATANFVEDSDPSSEEIQTPVSD